jgi:glucose dehydrogenase
MKFEFQTKGELFEWRGPAPYYFVRIDRITASRIKQRASAFTYGWGVVHVHGQIKEMSFQTALIPQGDTYCLPIKNALRLSLDLRLEDEIDIKFNLGKGNLEQ